MDRKRRCLCAGALVEVEDSCGEDYKDELFQKDRLKISGIQNLRVAMILRSRIIQNSSTISWAKKYLKIFGATEREEVSWKMRVHVTGTSVMSGRETGASES